MNFLKGPEVKERTFRVNLTLTPAQAEIERGMKRFTGEVDFLGGDQADDSVGDFA